jgi:hypothetical protein
MAAQSRSLILDKLDTLRIAIVHSFDFKILVKNLLYLALFATKTIFDYLHEETNSTYKLETVIWPFSRSLNGLLSERYDMKSSLPQNNQKKKQKKPKPLLQFYKRDRVFLFFPRLWYSSLF